MKRFKIRIRSWHFVWLMAVFCELMLHIWTHDEINFLRLLTVLLFASGLGSALAFIVSLLPTKAGKWTAAGFSAFIAVFTLLEHFLKDAYQVFMTPATVLAGAGGVAEDYFGLIMVLLLRDFWRILLLLAPVVLFVTFMRRRRPTKQLRVILAACAVICYLLGGLLANGTADETGKLSGDFDTAVRSYGLHVALVTDLFRGGDNGDIDLDFDNIPALPPETTNAPNGEGQDSTEGTGDTQPPVVLGENILDIDFAALAASESDESVAKIHSYVASQSPSKQNEFTGMFKGKNLIFITAEAFAAEVIDPVLTPTLYRLATKGIHFTDYYQPSWGGSTSTGEFTNITGLVPADGINSINEGTQQDMFLLIGKQLQKQGYFSAAYHNHTYTYYGRDDTHTALGYDTFTGMGNGMELGVRERWPQSDCEMMDFTVQDYVDHEPFSIYYMTVSGHCLYSTSGNAMSKKNFNAVSHLPYSNTVKAYLAANLELEYAMASLVGQLEAAGVADDTLIVLATDHYPYGLEKSSTWGNSEDYLSELYGQEVTDCFIKEHSALIMWSGCLEDKNIVVDDPVFSLDILPTLSNLFGVEYDSRLMVGRDVFSDTDPLVFWMDRSWKTDKGQYNADKREFTPAEGVEVGDDYVEYITSLVKNKITYSQSVQKKDYFDYLTKYVN